MEADGYRRQDFLERYRNPAVAAGALRDYLILTSSFPSLSKWQMPPTK